MLNYNLFSVLLVIIGRAFDDEELNESLLKKCNIEKKNKLTMCIDRMAVLVHHIC